MVGVRVTNPSYLDSQKVILFRLLTVLGDMFRPAGEMQSPKLACTDHSAISVVLLTLVLHQRDGIVVA